MKVDDPIGFNHMCKLYRTPTGGFISIKFSNTKSLLFSVIETIMIVVLLSGCSEKRGKNDTAHDLSTISDAEALIQKAIDFEDFQEYLHPEIEGREVLCITGSVLPDNLKLIKHGWTIRIVSQLTQCDNCIIFDTIEIASGKARIVFYYPIEGIVCHLAFEIREGDWNLVSSEVIEHSSPASDF